MKTKSYLPICLFFLLFITSCDKESVNQEGDQLEKSLSENELDAESALKSARFDFSSNVVAIDYSAYNQKMYYWSTQGFARYGTYLDTDPPSTSTYSFSPASGKIPSEIAEIGIYSAPGTTPNKCYAYYLDGTMSVGTSNDLDFYAAPVSYICPSGKNPSNITGLAFNRNGLVFTWFNDGTVSVGSQTDLASVTAPYSYSLPTGKTYNNIIGMAIDRDDSDKIYTWYEDGTVSIGISNDLDFYAAPVPFD